jgi:hypothetical protein
MTIIMVTHDHELAARAHRKLHILDGPHHRSRRRRPTRGGLLSASLRFQLRLALPEPAPQPGLTWPSSSAWPSPRPSGPPPSATTTATTRPGPPLARPAPGRAAPRASVERALGRQRHDQRLGGAHPRHPPSTRPLAQRDPQPPDRHLPPVLLVAARGGAPEVRARASRRRLLPMFRARGRPAAPTPARRRRAARAVVVLGPPTGAELFARTPSAGRCSSRGDRSGWWGWRRRDQPYRATGTWPPWACPGRALPALGLGAAGWWRAPRPRCTRSPSAPPSPI